MKSSTRTYRIMLAVAAVLAILLGLAACGADGGRPSPGQMSAYLDNAPVPAMAAATPYPDAGIAAEKAAPVIYDYNGQVTTVEWLYEEFGPGVYWEYTDPHPDTEWVFRVTALRAKCGPAAIVVKVVDEFGNPLEGIEVVRYWPGAPTLPDFSGTTAKQWTCCGVHGPTNAEGDIGFGMGTGDYYWPPATAVSGVYVADFAGYGDYVGGLGMIAATDHCHIDVQFSKLSATDPNPPTPTPTTGPTEEPTEEPTGEPVEGKEIHFELEGIIVIPED